MNRVEEVEATGFLRRLRGGSQPVLLEASDGFQYVVKFRNNFQGPNLLFNEVIGTELFRMAGLPVPEWRAVAVSEKFISSTPECWLETAHGLVKPQAGIAFGSRFLEVQDNRVFEILSGGYFSRIRSRRDFWTAWALDVLAENTDNRQALFLEGEKRWLHGFFIDHGHALGGARGLEVPFYRASRYIDPRVYPSITEADAARIEASVRDVAPVRLAELVLQLPAAWKTPSALLRFGRLIERLGDRELVTSTIRFVLGMTETLRIEARRRNRDRHSVHLRFRCEGAGVCAPLSSPGGSRNAGRICDPVCTQKRFGPQAVHSSWLQASGF
jgi:hypothetical protein